MSLRLVKEPQYSQRRRRCNCVVAFCTSKSRSKGHRFCHKHARQHQKETNPLRYFFDALRQNARNRKKDFTLTIEEFKVFCDKTNYLELKGRLSNNAHIDRIRPMEGYSFDNIQILDSGSNQRKKYIDEMLMKKYGNVGEKIKVFYEKIPDWVPKPVIIHTEDAPF